MTSSYGFTENLGYSIGPYGPGNPSNYSLNAAGTGVGCLHFAQYPEAITHIGFPYRSYLGTPVELELKLETTDSDGLPTGTDVGGGSPTAVRFTPPANSSWNSTFQWFELTNPYTPSRGELLCPTLIPIGTPDASNYSQVAWRFDEQFSFATLRNFPYTIYRSGGTWSKGGSSSAGGAVAFRTATRTWGYPTVTTIEATTAGTVGHRVAKAFTYQSNMVSTFTVLGFYVQGRPGEAASRTIRCGIWDSSGTALSVRDYSTSITRQNWVSSRPFMTVFSDSVLPVLSAGTRYYAGLECVESDSRPQLNHTTLALAADRGCFPNGENVAFAEWNGSSWTETETKWPLIQLMFDEWNGATGGGEHSYAHIG